MGIADAHRWNIRYIQERETWLNYPPKQLVLDFEGLLPARGRVMDSASGVGATGHYLAQKGLTVVSLDISVVALKIAKQKYLETNTEFIGAVVDLADAWLPPNYFDVILNFCFLERTTFLSCRKSLKPGGLLFFENFVKDRPDVQYSEHFLDPNELLRGFADFEILHYDQINWKNSKGFSKRKVAQLVARKKPDK